MDDELELLHTRGYDVRGYWRSDGMLVIKGAVRDQLPARLFDIDDDSPLVMHHMEVALTLELPDLLIKEVKVEFLAHPHVACPSVVDHYHHLVGLSIVRGFTHKVRELFGGPRGCTHTTALLQAMAPVAMQCKLASRMMALRQSDGAASPTTPKVNSPEMREVRVGGNRNTCHVWAEDGEHIQHILDGTGTEVPIPITVRIRERGGDPDEWRRQRWG
ncbi:MAG: DUF2889 domain-containing protein [Acidimicrobiales bacterium]